MKPLTGQVGQWSGLMVVCTLRIHKAGFPRLSWILTQITSPEHYTSIIGIPDHDHDPTPFAFLSLRNPLYPRERDWEDRIYLSNLVSLIRMMSGSVALTRLMSSAALPAIELTFATKIHRLLHFCGITRCELRSLLLLSIGPSLSGDMSLQTGERVTELRADMLDGMDDRKLDTELWSVGRCRPGLLCTGGAKLTLGGWVLPLSYGAGARASRVPGGQVMLRRQKHCSSEAAVKSGVPQGTVLGPLIINDIGNSTSSKIKLFAEDCLIYRRIKDHQDISSVTLTSSARGHVVGKWTSTQESALCSP